jgi:hypothetical protein
VTVIDPRHPLYQRTLPLVGMVKRRDLGPCCIVLVEGISQQYIPVKATSWSTELVWEWASPLNLSSVQQLLAIYDRIEEKIDDELGQKRHSVRPANPNPAAPTPEPDLAALDRRTATRGAPGPAEGLSATDLSTDQPGGGA